MTIIGVVAAMTIPTLLTKHTEHATLTKLKKAQSILANALKMHYAKESHDDCDWSGGDDLTCFALKAFQEELKGPIASSQDSSSGHDIFGSFEVIGGTGKLLDDGIAVGLHYEYNNLVPICVAFDKKGNDHNNKKVYFSNNPYSYCFWMDNNLVLYPVGAPVPGKNVPVLTREMTCPAPPISSSELDGSGCTYWALKTGKITKKAGEWDDSIGDLPAPEPEE